VLEKRAAVALQRLGHVIAIFPLESRFIQCDRLGEVVCDASDLGSCQHAERFGLDLMQRRLLGDTVIGEELEDLSGLGYVLVARRAQVIYGFFRRRLRAIGVAPNVINHTVDEIVVQLVRAVVDTTEQRDMYRPRVKRLEPKDGGLRDQGCRVLDAVIGNLQLRQQLLGQVVQGIELLTATDCALDVTGAKIAGLPLELGNFIESRSLYQQTM
jgi:hypothetical protein